MQSPENNPATKARVLTPSLTGGDTRGPREKGLRPALVGAHWGGSRFRPPLHTCFLSGSGAGTPLTLSFKRPRFKAAGKTPRRSETCPCQGDHWCTGPQLLLSKDIHNGPKLGRKSPVSAGLDVRAGLGGGTTFRRPRPSPSSLHLQLELSLEGWRHFLCPLPLISRHSWQAQRRGSKNREGAGAAIPLSAENLEVGGREDTQCPEKANRVIGAFPVVFLPLGCLPGHSTPQRCSRKRPLGMRPGRQGWVPSKAALTGRQL